MSKEIEQDNYLMMIALMVVLFLAGIVYVGHVNSQDEEMIEACKHDAACVNPYTGKGLP